MTTATTKPRGRPRGSKGRPYGGLSLGAQRVALLLTQIGMDRRAEPVDDTIYAMHRNMRERHGGGRHVPNASNATRENSEQ